MADEDDSAMTGMPADDGEEQKKKEDMGDQENMDMPKTDDDAEMAA